MIPTEDSKALVRLLAFALAGDYEQADELIKWAYKATAGVERVVVEVDGERVNYQAVLDTWNDTMRRNIPKVTKMTDGRKSKIRQRVKEMGGTAEAGTILFKCFSKINESDFCNGENKNNWVATFDWFFSNDKNWTKVLEGNYDNRRGKTDLEKMKDEIAKADAYYEQRYGKPAGPGGNPAGRGSYGPDEQ